MKMIIEFETDNSAFGAMDLEPMEGNHEIKRILADISESLPFYNGEKTIKDVNGNTIGLAYFNTD